jgi:hypothetical protein
MSVYFISAAKCKELAGINGNTDDFLITPMIADNQRVYIEAVLGTALYDELITQVENNTVTVLNATLLDEYVIPCLVNYVKSDAAVNLNFKLTNKAVTSKNSENSTPVTKDESIYLMQHWKNRAEYYAERITKYLHENRTSYPLFYLPGTGFDTVHPNGINYTVGIPLDPCGRCGYQNCKCYSQLDLPQ